jgi:hypothetical protein
MIKKRNSGKSRRHYCWKCNAGLQILQLTLGPMASEAGAIIEIIKERRDGGA